MFSARLLALVAMVVSATASATSIRATSSPTTKNRETAIQHRDLMVQTLHDKARKVQESGGIFNGDTFCELVEQEMSLEEEFAAEGITGSCTCEGTLDTTLTLACDFSNICGDRGEVCGTANFKVEMSNLIDADGNFNEVNPSMNWEVCVDVDGEWLKEICFKLDYNGLEFLVPTSCAVTYDEQDCVCSISTVSLSDTFDIDVPCMAWDCTEVVPEQLKPYMKEDQCELLEGGTDAEAVELGSTDTAVTSFALFEQVPEDTQAELEATQASNSAAAGRMGYARNAGIGLIAVVLLYA